MCSVIYSIYFRELKEKKKKTTYPSMEQQDMLIVRR